MPILGHADGAMPRWSGLRKNKLRIYVDCPYDGIRVGERYVEAMVVRCLMGLLASVPLSLHAGDLHPGAFSERVASNGALVFMPSIEGLTCEEMARVVARIDASGYRDPDGPELAEGHPDREIFDYENALSAAEYFRCALGRSQLVDPGLAFDRD